MQRHAHPVVVRNAIDEFVVRIDARFVRFFCNGDGDRAVAIGNIALFEEQHFLVSFLAVRRARENADVDRRIHLRRRFLADAIGVDLRRVNLERDVVFAVVAFLRCGFGDAIVVDRDLVE